MLDPLIIVIALGAGLLFKQIGFPPMLGYLFAGFLIHPFGIETGDLIEQLSNAGITLLLFTIGLKLHPRDLAAPQVWAVGVLHIAISVMVFAVIFLLASFWLPALQGMDSTAVWTVAFALSFSSTVLAVKVFEDQGETAALYAKIAIGILIIQDLAAVFFLAASTGKVPGFPALLLFLLIPLRPLLHRILAHCGHGELVTLFGFALAFGGAALFDLFKVKGDLGALIIGVLLSGGVKSTELAKTLLSFKDLFLVGFFLSIGLGGFPHSEWLWVALLMGVAITFKPFLFYFLMTLFKLRSRTALLSSLALFNYSEFGLIVVGLAISNGWLPEPWLAVIAVALSISFFISVPMNSRSLTIYGRFQQRFNRWQRNQRLKEEESFSLGDVSVLILGQGRVGGGAYEYFQKLYPNRVAGIEEDARKVQIKQQQGINVFRGDASDRDFWERVNLQNINLIMVCLTNHNENIAVVKMIKALGYTGSIAVIARFPDQMRQLEALDCISYNFYAEAGHGFAEHVDHRIQQNEGYFQAET